MPFDIIRAGRSLRAGALAIGCAAGFTAGAAAAAPTTPFGSHRQPYSTDARRPTVVQQELDAKTAETYDKWKVSYLRSGCKTGQYYVKADTDSGAMVVSESQGYGMLITPMMAGHDPDAQKIFDGLLKYYLAHASHIDKRLMSASQDKKCKDIDGDDSATDGDLDAAYGLLLADLQWGSKGAVDYLGAARQVLDGLYDSNVNPQTKLMNLGDWVSQGGRKYRYASRSSDWMPGHFEAFAKIDARWGAVFSAHVTLIGELQTNFAAGTGLLPDFVIDTDTSAKPAPPKFLEAKTDGKYSYNACRDPWRIGISAAFGGSDQVYNEAHKINEWIIGATDGKTKNIRAGYALNGKALVKYSDLAFVAPFAVSAMFGNPPGAQAWLDALWAAMAKAKPQGYYPDTLKLLSMIAVSRNWLEP